MNSDFKDLLQALLANRVEFMIVGGYAVIHYTEPRYTKDLDILIRPTAANARRVYKALETFGAPLAGLKREDLTVAGNFFQIGVPPNRIDIIVSIPGVLFEEAYARCARVQLDDLTVPIIGAEDLIQAKLAAGRPQDLVDAGAIAQARLKKDEK